MDGLYGTSVRLGVRQLARREHGREAIVRIVVPLDPSRYLELPWARALAVDRRPCSTSPAPSSWPSPCQARRGGDAVDQLEREIETGAFGGREHLRLGADGARFPMPTGLRPCVPTSSSSTSPTMAMLLRESRTGRARGHVLVTLPHARAYREDWRDGDVFANQPTAGRTFFQRWYDSARVAELVAAVPALELVSSEVVRMQPNWNEAYVRSFPWLVPLGPFYGLLGREVAALDGDVVRLAFVKR
jgi:hypothetical protein